MSQYVITARRGCAAVLVGLMACAALIAIEFLFRYWAAVGVYASEDWVALTPDVRGHAIDRLLGLGTAVGFWAVAHAQGRRGLVAAAVVGAAAMWLAPQINAVFYVWRTFGGVSWEIALDHLVRSLPYAVAGALIGGIMWRIAYGRVDNLA